MKKRPGGSSADGEVWRGVAEDIRRSWTARGRMQLHGFGIEGTRLHERAIRAGTPPRIALMSESYRRDPAPRVLRLVATLRESGCRLAFAPDPVLHELTGGRDIGAIVGLVDLPPRRSLTETLQARSEQAPVLLVGYEVEDPGNVGALVRTALASGACAYVSVGAGDPYHPRSVRTSMGGVLKLPLLRHEEPDAFWRDLRRNGVSAVGAVSSGGVPLPAAPFEPGPTAILVGSEAFGLPPATARHLDQLVTVPMVGEVDSFSVNAAAAVVLYEIGRRRRGPVG